jgi:chemotaxis protein methyltransferase CheR
MLSPDHEFPRLKATLIDRTGHFYYQDKDDLLWEKVRRRLHALGLAGSGAYLDRLADPVLGEAEWTMLNAEITIGETFFFRYAEQFAALRDTILPDLLRRNRETRRLRIWSAGCANGSEPYSLAILLRRMLGDALSDWRITLLGTDLNAAALDKARAATFSPWALRSMPEEARDRDFLPAPGSGQDWQLRPQHRALVQFRHHNLLDLLEPTASLDLTGFDLVLCRNVLIYFHPDMVLRLVRALGERLVPGGWLLLGHAEPNPAFAEFLRPVSLPGTAAWRREGVEPITPPLADPALSSPAPQGAPPAATRPAVASATPPATRPAAPYAGTYAATSNASSAATSAGTARATLPEPLHSAPPRQATPIATPAIATPPAGAVVEHVRRLADLGDLDGAGQACRDGLAAHPGSAALHFYSAIIARARGLPAEAERAFRHAIALRDGFAMAHYHLGLLMLEQGRDLPGRRAIAAAARIAHGLSDDAPLEEADGMTARELRAAIRLRLDSAPGTGGC